MAINLIPQMQANKWIRNFYRKEKINCWERLITNNNQYSELLVQFDINCLTIKKLDLDMKLIREFLKTANSYIEERLDF